MTVMDPSSFHFGLFSELMADLDLFILFTIANLSLSYLNLVLMITTTTTESEFMNLKPKLKNQRRQRYTVASTKGDQGQNKKR